MENVVISLNPELVFANTDTGLPLPTDKQQMFSTPTRINNTTPITTTTKQEQHREPQQQPPQQP